MVGSTYETHKIFQGATGIIQSHPTIGPIVNKPLLRVNFEGVRISHTNILAIMNFIR